MNTLSVDVPESLHDQLVKLANREGVSVSQLANAAIAEKIAALLSTGYLSQRAQQGNRHTFEQALAKVPDTPPSQQDEL